MREEQLNVTARKGLITISSSRIGRMQLLIRAEIPTTTRFSSESRGNDPIEDVNSSTSKSNSSRKPSSTVSLEKTNS
jgi:hypothetical protein